MYVSITESLCYKPETNSTVNQLYLNKKNKENSRFELKIDSEVFPVLQEWWANVIGFKNYLESRLKNVDFMTHPVFCFSIITQTSDL